MKNPIEEEIKQIGREEGTQTGFQEAIGDTLKVRFDMAPSWIGLALGQVHDEARLRDLIRCAVTCGTIDEFQSALNAS